MVEYTLIGMIEPWYIETDPDLLVPGAVTIGVVDPVLSFELTLDVEFDRTLRRFVATKVSAVRREEGTEINGASLRDVRIQEYIRDGVREQFKYRADDGSFVELNLNEIKTAAIRSAGPSSHETLVWVARIYRIAQILNMWPAKAVQEQLGLTQPTATLWIRRARAAGIMVA